MTVHLEHRGTVALVTIDRPQRRNAVDHETLLALQQVQRDVVVAGSRCVVLTGAPPAFCAGADLTGVEGDAFAAALAATLVGFTSLPLPVIAAIDGPALGAGTQLVIAADLRVATARSVFGIPAAKLGLAVDHWTIQRLTREMGWPIARAMLMSAQTYGAEQLVASGAVHRIGDLADALAWASEIAVLAPLTISSHKLGLERCVDALQPDAEFEHARAAAWASADAEEGRTAFLAKRPAAFTGN